MFVKVTCKNCVKSKQLGAVPVGERTARAPSISWLTISVEVTTVVLLAAFFIEFKRRGMKETDRRVSSTREIKTSITPKPLSEVGESL